MNKSYEFYTLKQNLKEDIEAFETFIDTFEISSLSDSGIARFKALKQLNGILLYSMSLDDVYANIKPIEDYVVKSIIEDYILEKAA